MPEVNIEIIKDVINEKIAKRVASMGKAAPANITSEEKWSRAKEEAKKTYGEPGNKLSEDKWYATVNHIYQNMGGEFKSKKKEKAKMKTAEKKKNNKHTCPCGKSMSKVDGDYGTKVGWSKYKCSDCGYSRDFRDGAPIYQAMRIGQKWVIAESGMPLFSIDQKDAHESIKGTFLSRGHGDSILKSVAKLGAYNAVAKWFPDGERAELYHPAMKMAAMGIEDSVYRSVVKDALSNKDHKKIAAKVEVPRHLYAECKDALQHPGAWVDKEFIGDADEEEVYGNTIAGDVSNAGAAVKDVAGKGWEVVKKYLNQFMDEGVLSGEPQVVSAMYYGPGHYVKAQIPSQTDVSVSEPGIEAPGSEEGMAGPSESEGKPGLVDEEVSKDLLSDKKDTSNVVQAIGDVIASIITNSTEATVDDIVGEVRDMFLDDDAFSEFKGALEEKVDSHHDDEEQEEVMEEEPMEIHSPPEDGSGAAPLTASNKNWEDYSKKVWASREDYRQKYETLREQIIDQTDIVRERDNLLEENRRLLIERSARIRAPRVVKVARKMYETGELGTPTEKITKEDMVKAKFAELMRMSDEEFMEKEAAVDRIYKKVASRGEKLIQDENHQLLSFIPVTVDKGVVGDFTNHRCGSGNKELYPWSRAGIVRKV